MTNTSIPNLTIENSTGQYFVAYKKGEEAQTLTFHGTEVVEDFDGDGIKDKVAVSGTNLLFYKGHFMRIPVDPGSNPGSRTF